MADRGISWQGVLLRLLVAVILVFASYNPDGYSYYHWLSGDLAEGWSNVGVAKIFVGVVLLIGWTVFLRATLRALGPFGLFLALAFFGTLIWMVVDWGWVPADSVRAMTYIVLVALCGVLATGVSWSHIRRRFTGQIDVDEVDND